MAASLPPVVPKEPNWVERQWQEDPKKLWFVWIALASVAYVTLAILTYVQPDLSLSHFIKENPGNSNLIYFGAVLAPVFLYQIYKLYLAGRVILLCSNLFDQGLAESGKKIESLSEGRLLSKTVSQIRRIQEIAKDHAIIEAAKVGSSRVQDLVYEGIVSKERVSRVFISRSLREEPKVPENLVKSGFVRAKDLIKANKPEYLDIEPESAPEVKSFTRRVRRLTIDHPVTTLFIKCLVAFIVVYACVMGTDNAAHTFLKEHNIVNWSLLLGVEATILINKIYKTSKKFSLEGFMDKYHDVTGKKHELPEAYVDRASCMWDQNSASATEDQILIVREKLRLARSKK